MPIYKIEIIETLSTVIDVDSGSLEKAIQQIQEQYQHCDIVLDYSHHINTQIQEYSST